MPAGADGRAETTAIIAATHLELARPAQRLGLHLEKGRYVGNRGGMKVVAVASGLGPTNAAAAFIRLRDHERLSLVISLGFAGALNPALSPGQCLAVNWIINGRGRAVDLTYPIPLAGVDRPENRQADSTLLTLDHLLQSPADKRTMLDAHWAAMVDMESFALAKVAADLRMPFKAYRAISDSAAQTMPGESTRWISAEGRMHVRAVASHLLRHPKRIGSVLRLGRQTSLAANALADAVERLLPA